MLRSVSPLERTDMELIVFECGVRRVGKRELFIVPGEGYLGT